MEEEGGAFAGHVQTFPRSGMGRRGRLKWEEEEAASSGKHLFVLNVLNRDLIFPGQGKQTQPVSLLSIVSFHSRS